MKTEEIALSRVSENEANPRTITEANFQKLVKSILVFPKMLQLRPIVVDETYKALGGNMRTRALCHIVSMTPEAIMYVLDTDQRLTDAEKLAIANYWSQWKEQPTATIVKASDLTEAQKKEFIIKDNAGFGDWDTEALANQFGDQPLTDWAIPQWILGMAGINNEQKEGGDTPTEGEGAPKPSLVDKFVVPPFSILDTRQGYWVERKKQWRAIVSSKDIGASREQTLVRSKEMRYKELYSKSEKFRKEKGISFDEYLENYVSPEEKAKSDRSVLAQGTSLFDPVLAEIIMRWFCKPHGKIIDPFGGEQTKGVVAGTLGYDYQAVEIRKEQVDINTEATKDYGSVKYFCGDSNNIGQIIKDSDFDLCFTSPPYYDLEVYSKEDMSALGTYEEFMSQYENIFKQCVDKMKDGSFLVVKIGEVRNKKNGEYRNFVGDNISTFLRLGLHYYNELILIEQVASRCLRADGGMKSRKTQKCHQNVLVFYKGEMDEIKKTFEDMRQPEKMHTNVLVFYKGDPKHVQDHFQPIEYNEEEAQQLADTFNSVAPPAGEEEQPAEEGGQSDEGTDD